MSTTKSTIIEDLGQGVQREWLEDGRIMVLRMPDGAHREAIDIWFNTLTEHGDNWDRQNPFLVLHDARKLGFSYYFRQRAVEAGKHAPDDLLGRGAVVLAKSVVGYLLAAVTNLSGSLVTKDFDLKVFIDYDQALAWLREAL